MAHWLMKSEPESYGWDDLVRDGGTEWDGVRNNAARLHLKAMKPGDEAFFYHSMSDKAVVGIMRVTREAEPDPKDADWVSVRVEPVRALERPGHPRGDQGRAGARQDGTDPPVAPVGRAGARRRMGKLCWRLAQQMMLLALLVAAAPVAETPKAYMERLYASYRNPNFNPFDHPERYFAPPLMAAIQGRRPACPWRSRLSSTAIRSANARMPDGLHASVTTVTLNGRDKATVRRRDRLHRRQAAPACT